MVLCRAKAMINHYLTMWVNENFRHETNSNNPILSHSNVGYIRRKIDISTCGWGIGLPSSTKRKEKRGALKLINKYSSIPAPSSSPSRHNSMRKSEKLDTFLIKPNFFSCQIEKLVQLRWHTSQQLCQKWTRHLGGWLGWLSCWWWNGNGILAYT